MIQFNHLKAFDQELIHFVSTRHGGVSEGKYESLNLSDRVGDEEERVVKNREILCQTVGIDIKNLYIPHQIHDTKIAFIDANFRELSAQEQVQHLEGIDAAITNQPQTCLAVTTADCVPIILYAPTKKIIAAVHAGWRGTAKRILSKTLDQMIDNFGCAPSEIYAAIGPSIDAKSYLVGDEVKNEFTNFDHDVESIFSEDENGKLHLDLKKANLIQLLSQGLREDKIEVSEICTYCDSENFFSARKLGNKSGRFLSGIMMK